MANFRLKQNLHTNYPQSKRLRLMESFLIESIIISDDESTGQRNSFRKTSNQSAYIV